LYAYLYHADSAHRTYVLPWLDRSRSSHLKSAAWLDYVTTDVTLRPDIIERSTDGIISSHRQRRRNTPLQLSNDSAHADGEPGEKNWELSKCRCGLDTAHAQRTKHAFQTTADFRLNYKNVSMFSLNQIYTLNKTSP